MGSEWCIIVTSQKPREEKARVFLLGISPWNLPGRRVQGIHRNYSHARFLTEPISLRTEYFFLYMIMLTTNQYNLNTNL